MARTPPTDPYAPCHCGSGKKYKFCCMKADREKGKTEPPRADQQAGHASGCGCPIDHNAERAIKPKPADATSRLAPEGAHSGQAPAEPPDGPG